MPRTSPPAWYRNPAMLGRLAQGLAVGLVVLVLVLLLRNAAANMGSRGLVIDPGFLWTTAPFNIGFSPFINFVRGNGVYWQVFVIGAGNTLLVAAAGIVSATVLGTIIGVMRLSTNLLARRLASAYIETFRNLPLLLQVFFWHFIAILPLLPARKESWILGSAGLVNREGVFLSRISFATPGLAWLALVVAIAAIIVLLRWGRAPERTGREIMTVAIVSFGVVAGLVWFAAPAFDPPRLERMGVAGGFWIPVSLLSLWWALTVSTAAFIAEAVRAGIIAVPKGQREASKALGLSRFQSLRLVEMPQALRIIIPPTISQYLNLFKNSSLAVAVGYDDIVNIWMGATLNQTGQAIIIIAVTMAFFTTVSLLTSFTMNAYNSRVAIKER
ncbi:amino acid ABC transporter permease [Aestuariivirga sp. YIM B02566]|uniref:ABC transporter permease subunit n=1 Tax=Taklimakanibacter albus TaxID=2800327 RepID=A0ACC5QZV2_9HYPH|nr:ABC transporter permease subunit [Aestuariivirga sp. YIM B02566]MBK1865918.1 ABC transporter permease subunit [Aestuariivirga sp. YIM B02566]